MVDPFTYTSGGLIRLKVFKPWHRNTDFYLARVASGGYYTPGYNNATDYLLVNRHWLRWLDEDEAVSTTSASGIFVRASDMNTPVGGYYLGVAKKLGLDNPQSSHDGFITVAKLEVITNSYYYWPPGSKIVSPKEGIWHIVDNLYAFPAYGNTYNIYFLPERSQEFFRNPPFGRL